MPFTLVGAGCTSCNEFHAKVCELWFGVEYRQGRSNRFCRLKVKVLGKIKDLVKIKRAGYGVTSLPLAPMVTKRPFFGLDDQRASRLENCSLY